MWQAIVKHHVRTVITLSIILNAVIIMLSGFPGYQGELPDWIAYLPMMNAIFNSFTFLFLLGALFSILNGQVLMHQRFIYAAFTTTSLFLVSYVIFHFMADSTPYGGTGVLALIYYFVLITHIILAAVIVPLALMSFFTGYKGIVSSHKKWVRWTMPLWLYVSFTGVLVYLMISPYYVF